MSAIMEISLILIATLLGAGLFAEYLCKRAAKRREMPWSDDTPAPSRKIESLPDDQT